MRLVDLDEQNFACMDRLADCELHDRRPIFHQDSTAKLKHRNSALEAHKHVDQVSSDPEIDIVNFDHAHVQTRMVLQIPNNVVSPIDGYQRSFPGDRIAMVLRRKVM